nr:glycosyltransferase [Acetobacter estunensis]
MTDRQLEALEKRLENAESLLKTYKATSALHGMRADGLEWEAGRLRRTLFGLDRGPVVRGLRTAWLLAHGELPSGVPLRLIARRAREIAEQDGIRILWGKVRQRVGGRVAREWEKRRTARSSTLVSPPVEDGEAVYRRSVSSERLRDFTPRVLIVAELSIPQCAKYRVWQRKEELERLGWQVDVMNWHDVQSVLSGLQVCTDVIFYRTPAVPDVRKMIDEARRLGLSPWWEVDDLIFDVELYRQNSNLLSLPPVEQAELLKGAALYRECLELCGRGIASTRVLGEAMSRIGIGEVGVIENALDDQTLAAAETALTGLTQKNQKTTDDIVIVYGSGTRTHDGDFLCCAEGLAAAMEAEPRLRLRIVGELTVPPVLLRFGSRVETLEGRDYPTYMAMLAAADLTVTPLELTIFNDAKSNIKFLEASILRVPSVCSPCDAFRGVIVEGQNGFLAEGTEAWRDAVLALARDPVLRRDVGESARRDVLAHYRPDVIAREQVARYFPLPAPQARQGLRVLSVNVFFEPRSFGGATLVAEEMATRLSAMGCDVGVFTSGPSFPERAGAPIRHEIRGMPVMAFPLPLDVDPVGALDNPRCSTQFAAWLDAFRPDVVHFHSVQGLGVGILQVCAERGIPHVITLHDAWWLCERQFMVKADGRYCFQRHIDLTACQRCVPGAHHLQLRQDMMQGALYRAQLLLSPSASHRALYLENGIEPERIQVNRNGFSWPVKARTPRKAGKPLRFGFVSGTAEVKGFSLIRKAFEALERNDWELVLIDNTLNLGFSSVNVSGWRVKGEVVIRPAYTDETRDDFFNAIDVLLFPSQWMESYGLTVREALSRNVWVIATAPGGQAEDIEDGVNGTLIPLDGRFESLQTAIEGVLTNKERFSSYVNPHREELPTFESQAAELKAYLESVIRKQEA